MPEESKPFGVKVTDSFSRRFQFSLWKLTAVYVAILAIILFLSSFIIYSAFSSQLVHRFRDVHPIPEEYLNVIAPAPSADDVRADLINSLILVNGFLLVIAGFSSYWLAKLTLSPINEAYEKQRAFLSDASHELRTPLAILKTDLENEMAAPGVSLAAKARAESNLEEVDRMGRLVSDLLLLANSGEDGSNRVKNVQKVDLTVLARQVLGRFDRLATEHQVTLRSSPDNIALEILTNEELLQRVLTNLVKNGILYNRPNGSVTINMAESGSSVIINIVDTGIGISPEDLPKIFNRFYRSDKSRSRATGGSGLGLAIVRSSVEQLGGSVTAKSELEKGSSFTIKLPKRI